MDKERLLELAGALDEAVPTHSPQYEYLKYAKQSLDDFKRNQDTNRLVDAIEDIIKYLEVVMEPRL